MQAVDLGAQQPGQRLGFGNGDQGDDTGIGENTDLAAQMIFNLRQAGRGIYGNRNGAGEQDAEEAGKKLAAGGQHECNGLLGLQSACLQPGSHRLGVCQKVRVSDGFGRIAISYQGDVRSVRMVLGMPDQGVNQRARPAWRLAGGLRLESESRCNLVRCVMRTDPPQGVPQVARHFGVHHVLFRQMDAKRPLQPVQQFHAFQAVETEVTVKKAVQGNAGRSG